MTHTITVTKNKNSEVLIEGEITAEAFEKHRDSAIRALGKNTRIDGFRPGNIPANVLEQHISPETILQEMADRAIREHYPLMLDEHKIDAIGRPDVVITKLAPKNPLGFKITTAVMPVVTLPDYKKLAGNALKKNPIGDITVGDEELTKAIDTLRERIAHAEHDHSEDDPTKPHEHPLPELNDEFVKKLGDFANVEDFKAKFRMQLADDKLRQEKDKRRAALLDAIIAETKMELPNLVIEAELDKMSAQFKRDIERFGLKPEDYLAHLKKTEDDMRKEWRPDAEKRAKAQLVLNEIAKVENVSADPQDVEREVAHALTHDKNLDKERLSIYIASLLTNEKVLESLEQQQ